MTPTTVTAKISTPSDREIRIEREFNAPRARVWRAFTYAELIAQWWGRGQTVVVERLELARGGRWRFVEQGARGPMGFEGRFREVKAPERLVRSFEWDGMPAHVIIETIGFEDLSDGRTRVITTQQFHTPEERDGFLASGVQIGMDQAYAGLDRVLAEA